MIWVEMRDQDRVDGLRIDAGCLEVVEQVARGVGDLACSPGIDQHECAAVESGHCGHLMLCGEFNTLRWTSVPSPASASRYDRVR